MIDNINLHFLTMFLIILEKKKPFTCSRSYTEIQNSHSEKPPNHQNWTGFEFRFQGEDHTSICIAQIAFYKLFDI